MIMKMKRSMILGISLLLVLFRSPTLVMAMMDFDEDPTPVVTSGSFICNTWGGTTMDEFSVGGGEFTAASFSFNQGLVIYNLSGYCDEGETLSLNISGSQWDMSNAMVGLDNNRIIMSIQYLDASGQEVYELQTYDSGPSKSPSLSGALSGTVPVGAVQVIIKGSFTCSWSSAFASASETVGVLETIDVRGESLVAPGMESEGETEIQPGMESEPETEPEMESSSDANPWDFRGPLSVILIIAASAMVAAVIGAIGLNKRKPSRSNTKINLPRDPAYERKMVPNYPEFITGEEGEQITRNSDGTIEVTYTGGEVAKHFKNGTIQVKNPDGSVWEEWSDGTVSATEEGVFVTKTPDGTMTIFEPSGEETIYHPDGTSIHTNQKGYKIIKNALNEVVTVEYKGYVGSRSQDNPDVLNFVSPYGGSVVIRQELKWETVKNERGRNINQSHYEPVFEGEIRTENSTAKFRSDGSKEVVGDDGSHYIEDAKGNKKILSKNGSTYEESTEGDILCKGTDGTTLKGNAFTGEVDFNMSDGTYCKIDADGNSSFYSKEFDAKGVGRKDGYFKVESQGESFTKYPDGTMVQKDLMGNAITQKPDGTIAWEGTKGEKIIQRPDGTIVAEGENGVKFLKKPNGTTYIQKVDGTVIPYKP